MCHWVREGEANAPSKNKTHKTMDWTIWCLIKILRIKLYVLADTCIAKQKIYLTKPAEVTISAGLHRSDKTKDSFCRSGCTCPISTPSSLPHLGTQFERCIVLKMVRQQIVLAALSKKWARSTCCLRRLRRFLLFLARAYDGYDGSAFSFGLRATNPSRTEFDGLSSIKTWHVPCTNTSSHSLDKQNKKKHFEFSNRCVECGQ